MCDEAHRKSGVVRSRPGEVKVIISLYGRLRKNKVVVLHICAAKRQSGEEGKEHILEICAERLENLHPAETFHAFAVCKTPLTDAPDSSGLVPAEVPENVPPFYKKTNDYSLAGIERIFSGNKEYKTCAQYIGEAAYYANFLPYLQRDRHNYVPYFHIVVPRRKIRT